MVAVSAAALVVLLPFRGQSAVGGVQISQAKSAAEADAETADGKKFGEALAQAFGREHGSTIQRCAKDVDSPDHGTPASQKHSPRVPASRDGFSVPDLIPRCPVSV